jgi:hypothetical protein
MGVCFGRLATSLKQCPDTKHWGNAGLDIEFEFAMEGESSPS